MLSDLLGDVLGAPSEVITPGWTLERRAEAIKGRLEHIRGTALGFRNLIQCITRALLDAGGFRPALHPQLR